MTEVHTATEPHQPLPLPKGAQRLLRTLLGAGGTGFIDEKNRFIPGTQSRPGQAVRGASREWLTLVVRGLLGGERGLLMVTRAGRHFAATGVLLADEEIATTDLDLAAWGKGEVDYLSSELLEAIDGRFDRVVTTRREALDLLLQEGVVTVAEARQDV
jgi:hypothetical protein